MKAREASGSVFSWRRRVALSLWAVWEWLFARIFRLYEVPGDLRRVVRIGFHRWPGDKVQLQGGCVVRPGDWVGEIHLNSRRFAELWEVTRANPNAQVSRLIREMRFVLSLLAGEAQAARLPVPAVAFYGKTLLHRGATRLGFEVRDLPSTTGHRWLARYERWLLRLYHPRGSRRVRAQEPLRILWLATPELVRRYGRLPETRSGQVGPLTTPRWPDRSTTGPT